MLQKKLFLALITVFIALSITFVLIRNIPGDVIYSRALAISSDEGIPFDIAYERAKGLYGQTLEGSIFSQYILYIKNMASGNLGESIFYKIPVIQIVLKALPWTAFVVSISVTLSFFIGTRLGMLIAWKRRSFLDTFITGYASVTDATPDFITALILLIIFAINLKWFPLKGAYDIGLTPGFNLPFVKSVLYHAFLPVLSYTIESIGGWALIMKSSAIDVLGEDYITAAKSKGLKENRIIRKYMGANAILPPFTSLAIVFAGMLGGAALIEGTFAYPGMGFFFGAAIGMRDYTLIQGLFLFTTLGMVVANMVTDLMYYIFDPRVRG